jgi:hypothetical protein
MIQAIIHNFNVQTVNTVWDEPREWMPSQTKYQGHGVCRLHAIVLIEHTWAVGTPISIKQNVLSRIPPFQNIKCFGSISHILE